MAPPMLTFDADSVEPCTLGLQAIAVAIVSGLPVACSLALSAPRVVSALCLAAVVAPRLLWRQRDKADGIIFHAALAFYWNLMYCICFLSPVMIGACCYGMPRIFVPLLSAYVIWALATRHELRDGRPWKWFATNEWGYQCFRRFLHLRLHVPRVLHEWPVRKTLILAVHPHGVASDYRILLDGILYSALPGREVLTLSASVLFCIPIVRELALWTRCIDASRPIAQRALERGHSLMVLPGGEMEQIRTCTGVEEVQLASRFGFVKLALEKGAALVPCYAFGCVDLYRTNAAFFAPREWLRKKLGVCIPLYRGSFGVLPKRLPLNLVFGTPLQITCAVPGKPTDDELKAAHALYVAALRQVFDENKERFGYGSRELIVS